MYPTMFTKNNQFIVKLWTTIAVLLLLSMAAVISTDVALAQDQVGTFSTEPAWRAVYFNNPDLSGQPVLHRDETVLDHNWGSGSPDASVNSDHFSARWTRIVEVPSGTYRFSVTGDDGVRVFINNELILNGWWDHGVETFTTERSLPAGHHEIRVEFYDRTGAALVKFSMETISTPPGPPPPPPPQYPEGAWRGEYYNNPNLSGGPSLVRQDGAIDFDWGKGAPAAGINQDNFSVRWTRSVHFEAATYRFTTRTDDGVRLFVDDKLIIDEWRPQSRTTHEAQIYLGEGMHAIRMEYFDHLEDAYAELSWKDVTRASVGNLITCVPPNPPNYAWIRVYRRDGDGNWYRSIPRGVGSIHASGYLKLDGLPVDINKYGNEGEPYWIEQWIDGRVTRSVGNTERGEPEFRIRPGTDNYTPWQCGQDPGPPPATKQPDNGYPTPTPTPPAPDHGAIVVDERDDGFMRGGPESGWDVAPTGYNNNIYFSQNSYSAQESYNWGRWSPRLSAGRYEVFVYIPKEYATTTSARYWVSHASDYTLRVVDQAANTGQWVSLGTYRFRGTKRDYVSLADVTYEESLSQLVAWDAVRWEPR